MELKRYGSACNRAEQIKGKHHNPKKKKERKKKKTRRNVIINGFQPTQPTCFLSAEHVYVYVLFERKQRKIIKAFLFCSKEYTF